MHSLERVNDKSCCHTARLCLASHNIKQRELLTADLQIGWFIVLSDGTACCAQVLTSVCILDILQSEGGHTSVTPNHHISIQTLNESRKSVMVYEKRTIQISYFPQPYCTFISTENISSLRCDLKKIFFKCGFNEQNRHYINETSTLCSVT